MNIESAAAGAHYEASRLRLSALVLDAGDALAHSNPVDACPGWSVHHTVSHLLGVVEDALAGRLVGPPDAATTAAEVARHAERSIEDVVADWSRLAPEFEARLTEHRIWPAMFDVISHEHDIRTALGAPGARDEPGVIIAAKILAELPTASVRVTVEELARPGGDNSDASIRLTAPAFEIFRFRLGRRSVDQVLAMPWVGDPRPHLDQLFVFGPTAVPLTE